MVVIYKLNLLNAIIALLMGLNKSYIALPNLILDRKLVPELVQYKCTSENISQSIRELLDDVGKRKYQMDGFDEIHSKMRAFSSDKELHNLFCNYLS
jgi:lipid-A-disaccharide synthase